MIQMLKRILNIFQYDEKDNSVVEKNVIDSVPVRVDRDVTSEEWSYLNGSDSNPIVVRFSWKSYETIDTFVFLLGKENKIVKKSDLIFYNSEIRRNFEGVKTFDIEQYRNKNNWREQTFPCSDNGAIWIETGRYDEYGDDNDCEVVHVDFREVDNSIETILFAHVVYSSPCSHKASFGKDTNFCIHVSEKDSATGLVNVRCENLENKNILLSCALKRKRNGWRFEFINECINGPVQNLIDMYVE